MWIMYEARLGFQFNENNITISVAAMLFEISLQSNISLINLAKYHRTMIILRFSRFDFRRVHCNQFCWNLLEGKGRETGGFHKYLITFYFRWYWRFLYCSCWYLDFNNKTDFFCFRLDCSGKLQLCFLGAPNLL